MDVKQLRQSLGLSRDALARQLGVTAKTIYLWEKGKNKPSPLAQQKLEDLSIMLADIAKVGEAKVGEGVEQ